MHIDIVNDVRMPAFYQDACFLGRELQWHTQEHILLRQIGYGADQDPADIVRTARVADGVDIKQ
jgi:hypothetical protein